jgi:hypothetical protein
MRACPKRVDGYLVRVVRRWDEIEEALATKSAGPWFVAINETRLTDLVI